jgi:uncharacterized Zn finger protein (UPF0148 family)
MTAIRVRCHACNDHYDIEWSHRLGCLEPSVYCSPTCRSAAIESCKPSATPSPPAEPPPVGRDLPDEPGYWTRQDGDWSVLVKSEHQGGLLFAIGWCGKVTVSTREVLELPRGNWFRASPSDDRIAELEAEKQRLEGELGDFKSFCPECGCGDLIDMVERTEPGHRYCAMCKQEVFRSVNYATAISANLSANANAKVKIQAENERLRGIKREAVAAFNTAAKETEEAQWLVNWSAERLHAILGWEPSQSSMDKLLTAIEQRIATAERERDEARAGYRTLDNNWAAVHNAFTNAIRTALAMPGATVPELVCRIEHLLALETESRGG